nr:hypothetical protein [Tanacetum cinerariifolium]
MKGCKVMRTVASVEIEIMLILRLPCCLSSSSVRCLESSRELVVVGPKGRTFLLTCYILVSLHGSFFAYPSYPGHMKFIQVSSRVPVPLPEDPYEAIRQPYLDGTDTESEPFEDPVETETPELPLTVASPTSLPEGTPPTLVPILCRTTRIVVRVPLAMSPGLFSSMEEVGAMSKSTFCKRFRSSYESSPSASSPDLPSRKLYKGTSELVEDDKDEENDDVEDEEIKEIVDSNSIREDAKDEGLTTEDEDPATGDEGLTVEDEDPATGDEGLVAGDEGLSMGVESHGLDDEGHSVESNGIGLGEEEEVVPEASPTTAEAEGFLTKLGAQVEMQRGLIRDHTRYQFSSLAHEQERTAMTFGDLWRPVLALEAALQRELQEMRGRVITLEQEKDRRERRANRKVRDVNSHGKYWKEL